MSSTDSLLRLIDSNPRLDSNDPSSQEKEYDDQRNLIKIHPSGFSCIFNNELNLEFRNFQTQESISKVVNLRLLVKFGNDLEQVRFEVSDDSDLYYYFESIFDRDQFNQMKEQDQLTIDFEDFPIEVMNLLQDCQNNDSETQVTFVEENDPSDPSKIYATMEFLQILELKAVEIFRIRFTPSDPEFVQDQVQYRFDQITQKLAYKKAYLKEFDNQFKTKNPILYRTVAKGPRSIRK
ncbi:hypothetical protein TRFO_05966 [Tritrichomonas foetus]|uniref:Spindle assembly abnormal protein 6 N-terminal domain-containing protein n=1 Tax=Tritrichomonas foetus TaxID=1144522 RepID=A0A1J4K2F5_9EUKA|nr:hypothetical protein TRFO_05966 [Tritrichomonas foetus]|eukprot:OHT05379.1 hypothetical protein TRFO_05966 [Tritrichomonas foetus]